MPQQAEIADGTVVGIHYTLRNQDGDVLDSSSEGAPLSYLHGASNIVPGLERQLAGRRIGDKLIAVVAPVDGYGERSGPEPQRVPRSMFPAGAELEEGLEIMAQGDDDEPFPLWVVGLTDDHVVLDHNHPLAGVTLHFEVEVVTIRPATREEVSHGHPHGPGGHVH